MAHWSLRSLLQHWTDPFRLYIHDDGTCTRQTLSILREKFINAAVIPRTDASREVVPRLGNSADLISWRERDYIAAKCIDFYLIGLEEWVIILDPDVLFFGQPSDLFELSPASLWMMDCFYSPYIDPEEAKRLFARVPQPVSGGLGRIRRDSIDLGLLREIVHFKT